jgi:hypothetical protein
LAPPESGDGSQHLARNPVTGRGEGVTLFSIRFEPRQRSGPKALAPPEEKPKKKAKAKTKAKGDGAKAGPPAPSQ